VLRAATNGQLRSGEKVRIKLQASGAATVRCRIADGEWRHAELASAEREVVLELAVPDAARNFRVECAMGTQLSTVAWDLGRSVLFFQIEN
jgi:hypothetical protein